MLKPSHFQSASQHRPILHERIACGQHLLVRQHNDGWECARDNQGTRHIQRSALLRGRCISRDCPSSCRPGQVKESVLDCSSLVHSVHSKICKVPEFDMFKLFFKLSLNMFNWIRNDSQTQKGSFSQILVLNHSCETVTFCFFQACLIDHRGQQSQLRLGKSLQTLVLKGRTISTG